MRIVDRKTFLGLPENTVFSYYKPEIFSGLCIKGGTLHNDFGVVDIDDAIKCDSSEDRSQQLREAEKYGHNLTLDFESGGRDGDFNEEQLFAVWGEDDVRALIDKLSMWMK